MSRRQEVWGWIVFALSVWAYLPVAIGGWRHPVEINLASYGVWLLIAGVLLYSYRSQGLLGWRLPFGFVIGNVAMLMLGLVRGGYSFNLGWAETIGLGG